MPPCGMDIQHLVAALQAAAGHPTFGPGDAVAALEREIAAAPGGLDERYQRIPARAPATAG